jgi:hypothetical protein
MFFIKLPQNRHPERSASQILSRDPVLVARSRRTSAVLISPMLLGAFQSPSPHRAGPLRFFPRGREQKTTFAAAIQARFTLSSPATYISVSCNRDHPERIAADPVVGLRWSKSSEQHGLSSTAGVLRLRATSAVSRDQSVRRFAQDDDSVGELTERRPLCGSGAHCRSLRLPNFLLVLVALASFMRFSPTENRTRGCVSKQRGRKYGCAPPDSC